MGLFRRPANMIRQFAESKLESLGVRGELSENDVDGLLAPIYDSLVELKVFISWFINIIIKINLGIITENFFF